MAERFTIYSDSGPSLWYIGTDEQLYRLDMPDPKIMPIRDRTLAQALLAMAHTSLEVSG